MPPNAAATLAAGPGFPGKGIYDAVSNISQYVGTKPPCVTDGWQLQPK